jgi:hypothetical protein
MPHRVCPACRKPLAKSGAVIFFGNALVHATCWSELRKPPGKAAMDSSSGRALQETSRRPPENSPARAAVDHERAGVLGLGREKASTALRTEVALTLGLPPEVVAASMASSLMRSTSDRISAPLRPFMA